MTKIKLFIVLLLIVITSGIVWFFVPKNKSAKNNLWIDGLKMSTTTNKNLQPITISFGPLTETYKDKKFGFSLKYPKELTVEKNIKSCSERIGAEYPWGFSLNLYNTDCQEYWAGFNPNAKILSDYSVDYLFSKKPTIYGETDTWIKILNSNEIISDSGTKILKQTYTYKFLNPETKEEMGIYDTTKETVSRYVLFNPQKGFYIISGPRDLPEFIELGNKIINTINY